MPTVSKWRIFCTTELIFKEVWSETAPTACPDNTNHTVNSDSISFLESIASNEVFVGIEDTGVTNGHFGVRGWLCDIPAGTTGSISYTDNTFRFPVSMMLVSFRSSDNSEGDSFSAEVGANTVVGVCTTDAVLGSTMISVNSTVLSNVHPGFYIDITNGTTSSHLGECCCVDTVNGTITTVLPVSNITFDSGSFIQQTISMCDNYVLGNSQQEKLGTGKIGSSFIPQDVQLRVAYTNNNGLAKKFHIDMEYLY
jgi:hypothetical protein